MHTRSLYHTRPLNRLDEPHEHAVRGVPVYMRWPVLAYHRDTGFQHQTRFTNSFINSINTPKSLIPTAEQAELPGD
jgi:hypothetical protein